MKKELDDAVRDPLLYGFISSPKVNLGKKKPVEFKMNKSGKSVISSKTRPISSYLTDIPKPVSPQSPSRTRLPPSPNLNK